MINTKLKSLGVVSGTIACLLCTSQAAVLVGWDNNTATAGDDPWAATYLDASLSGGSIDMSDGLVAGPGGGPGNTVAMKYEGFATTTTTQAVSETESEYFEWSVTVAGGFLMDVTNLEIATANLNTADTLKLELRSSVDGFASTLGTIQQGTSSGDLGVITFDINQSNLTGNVTYRLYGYWDAADAGTEGTNLHFRTDKASLDSGHLIAMNGGLTAVPEPSSTALLGLSGLALILRRRR
ncbi:PEP-CTERM protein-sorting domain-containing protein [Rubritalea squalenifaciens DSM 18772]|uniref:PEP-CTERM protein-sorting domain-containing protein n=1 Tax=Rubritalea squalenifaciens DSM 18772 TaxID=1123071 RepID=A0A1M6GY35_9BACT|nr:PEP-CTERM sorting domain-containing protein [Rubritalea squalenifaciens]SHJ14826.1 PEP-CTERM protein-sorting domain-containing protein [Rubritalea squalenifaciens DSM 18772]